MSAASHTPGRLAISTIGVGFELESERGEVIAQSQQMVSEDRIQGLALRKENARRLAACWNACESISTDDLESGVLGKLKNDRVQLLCALQALGSAFMSNTQWNGEQPAEIIQARAVISLATGKTSEAA